MWGKGELEYQPSFSVVIPVYNVIDEQLIECIESVLHQTYKNYELILVMIAPHGIPYERY